MLLSQRAVERQNGAVSGAVYGAVRYCNAIRDTAIRRTDRIRHEAGEAATCEGIPPLTLRLARLSARISGNNGMQTLK